MPWNDLDLNDPNLYASRPNPHVRKAPRLEEAEGPEEPTTHGEWALDFVFDDDPRYNRPLAEADIRPEDGMQAQSWAQAQNRNQAWAAAKQARPQEPKRPEQKAKAQPKPKAQSKAQPSQGGPSAGPQTKTKSPSRANNGKGHPYLWVGVIVVCTFLLSVIAVMMMPQVMGYFWRDLDNYAFINGELLRYDRETAATYKQYKEYMRQDLIYPGIFVDGEHVGGMTLAEAREALSQGKTNTGATFSVTIAVGNKTWTLDNTSIPATRDLGNVLDRAYAIGRSNTTAILGTMQTPFRERVERAIALREKGVNLETRPAYDRSVVREKVEEIVASVNRPPANSQIAAFDFDRRTFTFTDEQVGVAIDADALYEKVIESLNNGAKGAVVTAEPVLTQPTVTKAQLTSSFKMVAAYTTTTTSDKNRNNNIDLACKAINGTALMPGETFSFNAATGQRTVEKGYREAGAIAAGQSIEEVGGGICQVSSTLFNAVVRADLEIVSRSPHAWPSTYVNRGEDATVNWPNLDFKFKNNKSTPVFIITYYNDRKCSAEIWGLSLGEGVTIDLKSEVVKTMEPPSTVNYVNNINLPYGTSKETVKARTGYVVDTYKIWYENGQEIKREKLHTSTYKSYQRTVEYN